MTSKGTFCSAVPETCCHFNDTSTRLRSLSTTISTKWRPAPNRLPTSTWVCTRYAPRLRAGRIISSRTPPVLVSLEAMTLKVSERQDFTGPRPITSTTDHPRTFQVAEPETQPSVKVYNAVGGLIG